MMDVIFDDIIYEIEKHGKNKNGIVIYPENDYYYNWLLDINNIKKLLHFFKSFTYKYIIYNGKEDYYFIVMGK